ncbi:putative transmembrane protein [Toxoplasma gondii MAS]|uniref:Putative transmembrane protein n=1 Tax=Toxoplasma gondii MAS TaxID=943118 RepID=A0A086QAP4_TOXGO|nr:putative transmembrane protein [Toxoplasma gondii MAS]
MHRSRDTRRHPGARSADCREAEPKRKAGGESVERKAETATGGETEDSISLTKRGQKSTDALKSRRVHHLPTSLPCCLVPRRVTPLRENPRFSSSSRLCRRSPDRSLCSLSPPLGQERRTHVSPRFFSPVFVFAFVLCCFPSLRFSASFPTLPSPPHWRFAAPPAASRLLASSRAPERLPSLSARHSFPAASVRRPPKISSSAVFVSARPAGGFTDTSASRPLAAPAKASFLPTDRPASSPLGSWCASAPDRRRCEPGRDASAHPCASRASRSHLAAFVHDLCGIAGGPASRAAFPCCSSGSVVPCPRMPRSCSHSPSPRTSASANSAADKHLSSQSEQPPSLMISLSRALTFIHDTLTPTSNTSSSSSPSCPSAGSSASSSASSSSFSSSSSSSSSSSCSSSPPLPPREFASVDAPSASDLPSSQAGRAGRSWGTNACADAPWAPRFSPDSSAASGAPPASSRLSSFYSFLPSWLPAASRSSEKAPSLTKTNPFSVPYRAVDLIALFGRLLFPALLPLYAQVYVHRRPQRGRQAVNLPAAGHGRRTSPAVSVISPTPSCPSSSSSRSPSSPFSSSLSSSFSSVASRLGLRFPWPLADSRRWQRALVRRFAAAFSSLSELLSRPLSLPFFWNTSAPSRASSSPSSEPSEERLGRREFLFSPSADRFFFPASTARTRQLRCTPKVPLPQVGRGPDAWRRFMHSLFAAQSARLLDFPTFSQRLLRLPFSWPPFACFLPAANAYCYRRGVYRHLATTCGVLGALSAELEAEQPHPVALASLFHVLRLRGNDCSLYGPLQSAEGNSGKPLSLDAEAVRLSLLSLCQDAVTETLHTEREEEREVADEEREAEDAEGEADGESGFRRHRRSSVELAAVTLWEAFERKMDTMTLRLQEGNCDVPTA